jgi:anti-sigma-K factor RskA
MERVEAENKLLSVVSHRGRAFKGIFRPLPFAWGLVGLFIIIALVMSNLLLWRQVSKLQSVSQKPNFQVVALAGTNHAPEARGMLVISASGQSGTLIVDGLPALDVDHQYQLWLIIDDQRTNGGIFSVSRVGYASMWISSPRPLADYTAFGITVEPKGGSPGPTGDKVLGGQM